jgi:hypothetical protein
MNKKKKQDSNRKKEASYGSTFTIPNSTLYSIRRLLGKFYIKTVKISTKRSSHTSRPMKGNLELKCWGGEIGESTGTICKEHE